MEFVLRKRLAQSCADILQMVGVSPEAVRGQRDCFSGRRRGWRKWRRDVPMDEDAEVVGFLRHGDGCRFGEERERKAVGWSSVAECLEYMCSAPTS